jgi:hypothetical protein
MAYQVTPEDIQAALQASAPPQGAGGYQVTPEDIQAAMQRPRPSTMQQIGQAAMMPIRAGQEFLQHPVQGAANILGGVERGVQAPLTTGYHLLGGAAGLAGRGLQALGLPGFGLPQASKVLQGVQPLVFAPGERPELTPNLSQFAEEAAQGASGAKTLRELYLTGKAGVKGLSNLFDRRSNTKAKSFVNDLLNGAHPSTLPVQIADEIRRAERVNSEGVSDAYGIAHDLARQSGFKDNVSRVTPGLGSQERAGKIINTRLANSEFEKLRKLGANDEAVLQSFEDFMRSPSYSNAHTLQSDLGSAYGKLKHSTDRLDKQMAGGYASARRALRKDIVNSLNAGGAEEAATAYRNATNLFKDTVAPFREARKPVRDIVNKRGLSEVNPENIHNIMKNEDEALNAIKPFLSERGSESILANALKPGYNYSPTSGLSVDAKKLLETLNNVNKKGFNEFITPSHKRAISSIEKSLTRSKRAKSIAKYLGGASVGAGGLEFLNRYLDY